MQGNLVIQAVYKLPCARMSHCQYLGTSARAGGCLQATPTSCHRIMFAHNCLKSELGATVGVHRMPTKPATVHQNMFVTHIACSDSAVLCVSHAVQAGLMDPANWQPLFSISDNWLGVGSGMFVSISLGHKTCLIEAGQGNSFGTSTGCATTLAH